MINRSLLALLAIVVAYIAYVKPARENMELLRMKIAVLEAQIGVQQNVKAQRKAIEARVTASGRTASVNETRLYPPEKSNSLALVDLQQMVKDAAAASKVEVLSTNWGEPVTDDATSLTKIPLAVSVKGLPAGIDGFLKKVLYGPRYIRAERATITKSQDQLLMLNASLVAFKREAKHE